MNTGIRYSLAYEEIDACIAARLDAERWYLGAYPVPFMAYIVAWYRTNSMISLNQQDAIARKAARKK